MTIDGNGYTLTGGGANTNFRLVSIYWRHGHL